MGFDGILPGSGLSVRTSLPNPSTRPGLALPGRIAVAARGPAVPVEGIEFGLLTEVEQDGFAGRAQVEFARAAAAGPFLLDAGVRREIPFALPLPWETPVTVINGECLLNLRIDLRSSVGVDPELDRGDLKTIYVHPLPAQQGILATLAELEFTLRQVGLQHGRLPGVNQTLPFHQRLGYWAGPLYRGPFTELELTLVTDPYGVEAIFGLDRRLAIAGVSHYSLSRFRVAHDGAERLDWVVIVDGWLRHAIARHGAVREGGRSDVPLPETVRWNRPPDNPQPANETDLGTAGGGGGGGGDGT